MVYTTQTLLDNISNLLERHSDAHSVKLVLCNDKNVKRTRCQSEFEDAESTVTLYLLLLTCTKASALHKWCTLRDSNEYVDEGMEINKIADSSECACEEEIARYTVCTHASFITIQWCALMQRAICVWSLLHEDAPNKYIDLFCVMLTPYVPEMHWSRSADGYFGSHYYHVRCTALHVSNVNKEGIVSHSLQPTQCKTLEPCHSININNNNNNNNTPAAYGSECKSINEVINNYLMCECKVAILMNANLSTAETVSNNSVDSMKNNISVIVLHATDAKLLTSSATMSFPVHLEYNCQKEQIRTDTITTIIPNITKASYNKSSNAQSSKCTHLQRAISLFAFATQFTTMYIIRRVSLRSIFAKWEWEYSHTYYDHFDSININNNNNNNNSSNSSRRSKEINDNVCKIPSLGTSYSAQWDTIEEEYSEEEDEEEEEQQEQESLELQECEYEEWKKCTSEPVKNKTCTISNVNTHNKTKLVKDYKAGDNGAHCCNISCNNAVRNLVFIINITSSAWQALCSRENCNEEESNYREEREMHNSLCNEIADQIALSMTEALNELTAHNIDIFGCIPQTSCKIYNKSQNNDANNADAAAANVHDDDDDAAADAGAGANVEVNESVNRRNNSYMKDKNNSNSDLIQCKAAYSSEMLIHSIANSVTSIIAMSSNHSFKQAVESLLFSHSVNSANNSINDNEEATWQLHNNTINNHTYFSNNNNNNSNNNNDDDDRNTNPILCERSYHDVKSAIIRCLRQITERRKNE